MKKKFILPLLLVAICFTSLKSSVTLPNPSNSDLPQIMPLSDREDLFDDTRDH